MEMNRRTLLRTSAMGVVALSAFGLSACGNIDWTQVQAAWNKFVDDVTAQVAAGCNLVQGFIPTVETVAATVAALFGPAAETTVAGIGGAVNAVAQTLCSAMPKQPAQAFLAKLESSTEVAPITIGTVNVGPLNGGGKPTPVEVHGYSKKFLNQRHNYGDARQIFSRHQGAFKKIYQHSDPKAKEYFDGFAKK